MLHSNFLSEVQSWPHYYNIQIYRVEINFQALARAAYLFTTLRRHAMIAMRCAPEQNLLQCGPQPNKLVYKKMFQPLSAPDNTIVHLCVLARLANFFK